MIRSVVRSVVKDVGKEVVFPNFSWIRYWASPEFQDGESFDNGKLLLHFDDGFQSVYDNGLSVFQEKEVKATLYLMTHWVGDTYPAGGGGVPCVTWAQAKEMYDAGMDMECHTDSYGYMTAGTDEEIIADLTLVNSKFIANGIPAPEHIAYPVGDYNDRVLNVVDDLRKTGRSTAGGYINRKSSKYTLLGYNIEGAMASIKAAMDVAQANKSALILWGHHIGDLGLSVADLREIIDYGISIGVDFISTKELYDLMFYIDIRLSRDCADDQINIICKNSLRAGVKISIERSDDNGITYSEIAVLESGETLYSDTGLTLNKNYFYRVRGFRDTYYLPYSREAYCSTLITLILTSTGNGTGISTLEILPFEKLILTLDGTARFYTNSLGTEGESTTWTVYGSGIRYIKCPSGTSNLTMPKNAIYYWASWISGVNAASISGNISEWIRLTHLVVEGNNTLSGSITGLKLLQKLHVYPSNTLSGSITGLSLNWLNIRGSNTISGSVTALTSLTYLWIEGSNTISGDVTGLTLLNTLYAYGSNTLIGTVTNLIELTYLHWRSSNTISGSITNLTKLTYLYTYDANTLSGSIAGLTLLTYIRVFGSNAITGSIEGLTLLASLSVYGSNTISGDIKIISSKLTVVNLDPCAMIDYTSGGNWSKLVAAAFLKINPSAGYGYSVAENSLMIQEVAATKAAGRAVNMTLGGSNASMADITQGGIWGDFSGAPAPSDLAIAVKKIDITDAGAVLLVGITAPGGTGDGTGFPAGFGDWWRT